MSNVGDQFQKVLETEQKRIDQKIAFLGSTHGDLFDHLANLICKTKTNNQNVVFLNKRNKQLLQCPCITKVVTFSDPKTVFPKDKARNPFECAKIQNLLYENFPSRQSLDGIRKRIQAYRCDCKDCYLLAISSAYKGNRIKL